MKTLQDVIRKARYGHKNWVVYGENAAVASRESIKTALLACGTQQRFTLVHANCGTPSWVTWRMGVAMMRNMAQP